MGENNTNPYASHLVSAHSSSLRARREAIAFRAFVYSLAALSISFLVPLFVFLFLPEKVSTPVLMGLANVTLCAIFISGCVANVVALVCGESRMRMASVPVALINAVALLRLTSQVFVWFTP